jgi:taurine dioxygenase
VNSVDVRPLTPTLGAEIHGVDLRHPLSEEEVRRIEEALRDHLVVFFRDQDITKAQHIAFGRRFGELCFPPFMTQHGDDPEVLVLDQMDPRGEGTDVWHSDNTFMSEPPLGSILKAIQLPPAGGDTCFASAFAAYEALSDSMRTFLDSLHAVHDLTKNPGTRERGRSHKLGRLGDPGEIPARRTSRNPDPSGLRP